MSKKRVQEQFGASAGAYVTSEVHAKGESLARLVELIKPKPEWLALDIATGGGHTAIAFAPHVAHVVATDITSEMLKATAKHSVEKGLGNVVVAAADAESLPFENSTIDLVTCRLAAHHFPDVAKFVTESARVLRDEGVLGLVDNVGPGSLRSGRNAQVQRDAGRYVNAFEKLRDPSHEIYQSVESWKRHFYEAGFRLVHHEVADKQLDFDDWAIRMRVSPVNMVRLRAMLRQAPEIAAEYLSPQYAGAKTFFNLQEAILIGVRE
jgi:ubiquinone/menaquinone biosynthesis C-methylase UbiE